MDASKVDICKCTTGNQMFHLLEVHLMVVGLSSDELVGKEEREGGGGDARAPPAAPARAAGSSFLQALWTELDRSENLLSELFSLFLQFYFHGAEAFPL